MPGIYSEFWRKEWKRNKYNKAGERKKRGSGRYVNWKYEERMPIKELVKIKTKKQGLMACLLILRPSEAMHCLHHSSLRLCSWLQDRNLPRQTLCRWWRCKEQRESRIWILTPALVYLHWVRWGSYLTPPICNTYITEWWESQKGRNLVLSTEKHSHVLPLHSSFCLTPDPRPANNTEPSLCSRHGGVRCLAQGYAHGACHASLGTRRCWEGSREASSLSCRYRPWSQEGKRWGPCQDLGSLCQPKRLLLLLQPGPATVIHDQRAGPMAQKSLFPTDVDRCTQSPIVQFCSQSLVTP